jgi:hypothetical protein
MLLRLLCDKLGRVLEGLLWSWLLVMQCLLLLLMGLLVRLDVLHLLLSYLRC